MPTASPDDDDLERRFRSIVSPLAPVMRWDTSPEPEVGPFAGTSDETSPTRTDARARMDQEDEEHYVPPEPPPLPRIRGSTIGAVLLVLGGIGLVAFPALVNLSPTLTMVVGLLLILGGGGMLVSRLRGEHPEDGDSGAVL